MTEEHYWVSKDGLPWVEVTRDEWQAAEQVAGFTGPPGQLATAGFSDGVRLQGRITHGPVDASMLQYAKSRQQRIAECRDHIWHLLLHPATPNRVQVYCYWCPASINDIWLGTTDQIYMEMGDFTVVAGTHTATHEVDMPIDIFRRESFIWRNGSLHKEDAVQVQPLTTGISDGPPNAITEG